MMDTKKIILVLGASGITGREVARQLISLGYRPRVFVRSSAIDKVAEFQRYAEIIVGDLEDSRAVALAMRNVDSLYLVCAQMTSGTPGRFLERNAIDAAKSAGVKHVVKLSTFGAEQPDWLTGQWHYETEKYLMDSNMSWTMLRPSSFNTNALFMWAGSIKSAGVFSLPTGDGKWAGIDPADISSVAVEALTGQGHTSKIYTITGPESIDGQGYAAILSAVVGKPISFIPSRPDELAQGMLSVGFPDDQIDSALRAMASVKMGAWDIVTQDIERLLGRPAKSFESWAKRNISAFL